MLVLSSWCIERNIHVVSEDAINWPLFFEVGTPFTLEVSGEGKNKILGSKQVPMVIDTFPIILPSVTSTLLFKNHKIWIAGRLLNLVCHLNSLAVLVW